jgi:hypothetical protein
MGMDDTRRAGYGARRWRWCSRVSSGQSLRRRRPRRARRHPAPGWRRWTGLRPRRTCRGSSWFETKVRNSAVALGNYHFTSSGAKATFWLAIASPARSTPSLTAPAIVNDRHPSWLQIQALRGSPWVVVRPDRVVGGKMPSCATPSSTVSCWVSSPRGRWAGSSCPPTRGGSTSSLSKRGEHVGRVLSVVLCSRPMTMPRNGPGGTSTAVGSRRTWTPGHLESSVPSTACAR